MVFDGSSSLTFGTRIASYEWTFDDGSRIRGRRAERVYDRPGTYSAALWVEDPSGARDVDFCTIRVYSRPAPEDFIPTLFATYLPAAGLRAGQPAFFRIWPQGGPVGPIRIDYGDGTVIEDYAPYSAVAHTYQEPGLHVVTISASAGDLSVTQKVKVVVVE